MSCTLKYREKDVLTIGAHSLYPSWTFSLMDLMTTINLMYNEKGVYDKVVVRAMLHFISCHVFATLKSREVKKGSTKKIVTAFVSSIQATRCPPRDLYRSLKSTFEVPQKQVSYHKIRLRVTMFYATYKHETIQYDIGPLHYDKGPFVKSTKASNLHYKSTQSDMSVRQNDILSQDLSTRNFAALCWLSLTFLFKHYWFEPF